MSPNSLFKRRFAKPGAPPGTLDLKPGGARAHIHLIAYDREHLVERDIPDVETLRGAINPDRVTWVNITGVEDGDTLEAVAEIFGIHPLALSDVAHVGQRPKVEEYDDALFGVCRMAVPSKEGVARWEQVSLFLVDGVVISFQEFEGDAMESLRHRIRSGRPLIRGMKADYLWAMIIDAIVDGYFPILESFGDLLEELEVDVLEHPSELILRQIFQVKRELLMFRRSAWPLRDTLGALMRERPVHLSKEVFPYLRDTADHTMQIVDVVETYRELASSFVDVYLSAVGQRTNEVMRFLTVIASIFIPLTFIAGVFGMNFDTSHPWNMPELGFRYGYEMFWGLCLVTAGGLVAWFRSQGWLTRAPATREDALAATRSKVE